MTPSIPWGHHRAARADTDSDYGTLFSFWDRPFASPGRTRWAAMPFGRQPRATRAARPAS